MAIISNYNLQLWENNERIYRAEWDNWVKDEKDIERLVKFIRCQISEGEKPIVAVFLGECRYSKK